MFLFRSIVGRRCFFLIGTLYMYRCITMYITTLPVPGKHMVCAPKVLKHTLYTVQLCSLYTLHLQYVCPLCAAVQRLDRENMEDFEADLRRR